MPPATTLIDCDICPPGVHTYEVLEFAVKVTEPPEQNVVGPPAVIVAVGSE